MSKLADRIKQYGIPDPPYLPMAKDILVFRMPAEEMTSGGIVMPSTSNAPKSYGVLVAAGLRAMDKMAEHLVEIGDIVWFGKFEGEEEEIEREKGASGKYLLQMKVEGLRGSVDALERVKNYTIVRNEDETSEAYGQHFYVKNSKRKAA